MNTIHAVYQDGVFRPKEAVDLPESTEVEFEPRPISKHSSEALEKVYEILSERYESGDPYGAERHNDHQP